MAINAHNVIAKCFEVHDQSARLKAHSDAGNLLDVVLLNGKRLRDCTGIELGKMAASMKELEDYLEATKGAI